MAYKVEGEFLVPGHLQIATDSEINAAQALAVLTSLLKASTSYSGLFAVAITAVHLFAKFAAIVDPFLTQHSVYGNIQHLQRNQHYLQRQNQIHSGLTRQSRSV